jgi:hypothetical protein
MKLLSDGDEVTEQTKVDHALKLSNHRE